jgi:uncharacterized glyoxalase superfamily protein PhnB
MNEHDPPTDATILVPALYYDDAAAAMEWLERVLGFEKRLVVPGPNDTVVHAEMSFGPAVIYVATSRPEQKCLSPRSLPGVHQGLCIRVGDPDAAFARAKKAGAKITRELRDEEYGSRGFMVEDREGHGWYVGTYVPGAHWRPQGSGSG